MKLNLSIIFIALSAMLIGSFKKQNIEPATLRCLLFANLVNGGGDFGEGSIAASVYGNCFQRFGVGTGSSEIQTAVRINNY